MGVYFQYRQLLLHDPRKGESHVHIHHQSRIPLRAWRQIWSRLEPVLKDNHIPYRAWQTGYQRHATRLARELTADGKEHTIIVLGGDGTVNEVVDGIRDLDRVILGYIPVGSGNDFARSLGIPKDPKAALRLVLSPARTRPHERGADRLQRPRRPHPHKTLCGQRRPGL